jgi:hypothetical protein
MYEMFIEPLEAFAKNEIVPLKVSLENLKSFIELN